jgi:hypothetical protein
MKVLGGLGVATCALVIGSAAATAQIPTPVPAYPGNALGPAAVGPEGTTVLNRPRPEYDFLGIRAGSFVILPSIGLSGSYDSNIFATPSGEQSDFYLTESPSVAVNSDWNRHAVGLTASGQFKQYTSHDSENVNNGAIDGRGRYDISNGEYVSMDTGYALQHEDRASPNAPGNAKNPVQYTVTGGYLAYVRELRRIGFRVDSTVTSYAYNNQTDSVTGGLIVENDRDRIEYVVAPRVSYEYIPDYQAFLRVLGNIRRYNTQDNQTLVLLRSQNPAATSARRNSQGYEVDAGSAIKITSLITGEIYLGWLHQEYQSSLFSNVNGPAFGGNVLWNVTPLTSVKGSFSQSVAETTLAGISSSYETNFLLSVEHELLRNVLLSGSVGFVRDTYQGASRVDNTIGVGTGVRYLMNRNVRLTLDVSYSNRNSTGTQPGTGPGGTPAQVSPNADYSRVIAMVGAQFGF